MEPLQSITLPKIPNRLAYVCFDLFVLFFDSPNNFLFNGQPIYTMYRYNISDYINQIKHPDGFDVDIPTTMGLHILILHPILWDKNELCFMNWNPDHVTLINSESQICDSHSIKKTEQCLQLFVTHYGHLWITRMYKSINGHLCYHFPKLWTP